MASLILFLTTSIFCFYFFWVQSPWICSIPLIFFIMYSADRIISFSWWSKKNDSWKNIRKDYWWWLSWIVSMVGIIYLGHQQDFPRYSTSIILWGINIIARRWSFAKNYTIGEYIFIRWWRAVSLSLIIQSIRQAPHYTWWIAIALISVWQILYRYRLSQETDPETKKYFLTSKEICNHIRRYSIIGTILLPDRWWALVMVMAYHAIILGLYGYSNTLETYTQQPQRIIHPRDILRGKTFQDAKIHHQGLWRWLLTRLYTQWRVPSWWWVQFLQCGNIIAFVWLLLWTGIQYFQYGDMVTMLWYRGGVVCFVIALTATHRESYRYHRYKKIALIIAVTALYVTMLPLAISATTVVIVSALWQILHIAVMMTASSMLDQYGITTSDRLFWLSGIVLCTAITIIYLMRLPLSSDSIFALTCIIIGLIAFLAYQAVYQIRRGKE